MVERLKYTSPLGELSWIFIDGKGKRNFNDDGDIFSGTISFTAEVGKGIIKDIEEFYEEHKIKGPKKASMGWYHPYVMDDKNEKIPLEDKDGNVIEGKYEQNKDIVCLTFKTGITWPDGKSKVINTYNAQGVKVSLGQTKIGNGSTGCLAGQMSMYTKGKTDQGVTFYLNSVQIVTLTPFEGGDKFEEHKGFEGVDEESGIPIEEKTEEEVEEKATTKPRL